jgi:hypothetical protein
MMNLVDAYVTKILKEPRFNDRYAYEGVTWWEVKVEYNSYGVLSETYLTFDTEEKALLVKEGYHFLT